MTKQYLNADDIQEIMGIKQTKAYSLLLKEKSLGAILTNVSTMMKQL